MRISTLQIFNQGLEAFNRQQSKISILQQQISTGNRLTKPSDDPAAAARSLELEQTVAVNKQYNTNITLAENRLRLEDTTLNALENSYFRIKELAIQAGGALNDPTALGSIKSEIKERLNELLFLSNTRDNSGNFLFAGTSNQTVPFTESIIGSEKQVVYNGDQNYRSFQISETRQIKGDDNGSDIFLEIQSDYGLNESAATSNAGTGAIAPAMVIDSTIFTQDTYTITFNAPATTFNVTDSLGAPVLTNEPYTDSGRIEFLGIRTSITGTPSAGDEFTVEEGQYRSIFETVNAFIDTLGDTTSAERVADLDTILNDLDGFFDKVLEVRTSVGGRLNALESQQNDNHAYIVSLQTTLSSLRDTDLAEAISQLSIEQTTLDAAQAVFARITSSTLFNYLR